MLILKVMRKNLGQNLFSILELQLWKKVFEGKRNGLLVYVGEVVVDIIMKVLYDRIVFDDCDGGVWKQGWDVCYDGFEWDEEKFKVFVVLYLYNDFGWICIVEEYYQECICYILDIVVVFLFKVCFFFCFIFLDIGKFLVLWVFVVMMVI